MQHRPRVDETLLADVSFGDTHLYVTADRVIVSPPRRSQARSIPRARIDAVRPGVERRGGLAVLAVLLGLVGAALLAVGASPTVRAVVTGYVTVPVATRTLLIAGGAVLGLAVVLAATWFLLTAPVLVIEVLGGEQLTVRGEPTEERLTDIRTALRGEPAAGADRAAGGGQPTAAES